MLTQPKLDLKVSILKILTKTEKSLNHWSRQSLTLSEHRLDASGNLDLILNWSWLFRPPSLKKLNLTIEKTNEEKAENLAFVYGFVSNRTYLIATEESIQEDVQSKLTCPSLT